MKYHPSLGSKAFDVANYIILSLLVASIAYPFIYMFSVSVSDAREVALFNVKFLPKGLQWEAYKTVFNQRETVRSYWNSILYTSVGTCLAVLFSSFAAYPLSRKKFKARSIFIIIFTITMFFNGGIIPGFLNIQRLGLINTLWAIVLPPAFAMRNIILIRTNFQQVPESLIESAYLDGANDWYILFKIVLPLSKAILATIAVFASVGLWNSYFPPLLYLTSSEKAPLTIILRRILVANEVLQSGQDMFMDSRSNSIAYQGKVMSIRMATIFVTIGPIVLIYPFVQKYFVKGVMIGSLKG
ncbi:MAG: carbohydrate ABC transporter permease [Firmicutes bacterium]|nr:carbohydrate ABC transporter permease [Bacillota bacterium]